MKHNQPAGDSPLSSEARGLLDTAITELRPNDQRTAAAQRVLLAAIAAGDDPKPPRTGLRDLVRSLISTLRLLIIGFVFVVSAAIAGQWMCNMAAGDLLAKARTKIDTGEYESALKDLRSHSTRYRGEDAERRLELEVEATCKWEKPRMAQSSVRYYLAFVPNSRYAAWEADPCGALMRARDRAAAP